MINDKISVIGAAIIDVLAGPVDTSVFEKGSMAMDNIEMSFGGDALNEAVIMSRLGLDVEIITKTGGDDAGKQVLSFLKENGVTCQEVIDNTIVTGMNIVLIDGEGERFFLTNPGSSLRKLDYDDIEDKIDDMGDIVCFASMFVSPLLDIAKMERLFARIKETEGRRLVVDMTTAKNGETIDDIRPLLKYIDYLIPNEKEASLLTGKTDALQSINMFLEAGVKCIIVKCGCNGCIIGSDTGIMHIPAYKGIKAIDSTGAGDSFAAGFVYGLKNNMSLKECCDFACAVSSCVVEKVGAHAGVVSAFEPMRRFKDRIGNV